MSSIVYEIRNNQPNHQDKCEIVVSNPCFNNRFHPIDLISLNTFSTENEQSVKNPLAQAALGKENEFMSSFNYQLNKSKKTNQLQVACLEGDVDAIRRLIIKENYDLMKPDSNGFFPIHTAVINNKIEAVKCLLNSFACSPNVMDKNKNTCLHLACFLGFVDIVKLLLNHTDIDISCKNIDGKNCLAMCEVSINPNSKICADLIKNRLKQAWRQINVKLMDGSEISLDLISGSETNVEQLVKQIYQKLGLDEYHSIIFSLWICSKNLKLQLKPDQKPLQHLADWKRIIVPTLTNYDPLKEEPTLMLMRDARCSLKHEKKITNPNAIRLLCFEAYHNYIHSMYPTSNSDAVILAAVFMKIVNEGFSILQWRDFFQSDPRNLRLFVPTRKLIKSSTNEWAKLILVELEKNNSQTSSYNQTKIQFKFVSYCWNLPTYGSAFFYANVPLNNNKFQLLHVCVNFNGIHLLNTKTRSLELFYNYADIAWRIHHSPGSVEIYSKKHKLSIFLYTKQYNLINHLMLKLETTA